ncbi:MAG TPA: GNAT family N-acetyltransferase [Streptosporangiaceae bacterium]
MADIVVRALTADDSRADHLDLSIRAFGPHDEAILRTLADPVIADGRGLAAFDGDRMVGTALFHDHRQWWLGKPVPMAGVSGVTVAPEYRGRGVGRGLMTALIDLMAARGYPLSALYPATMHIYRRLGWELAGARYEAKLPARSLLGLPRPAAMPQVRRPVPGDAAAVIAVIGAAHEQAGDCGPITWEERSMRRWLTPPGEYADSHRYAFLAPDGFAAYRWRGNNQIFVDRVLSTSPETVLALWSVIASHSSVADTVIAQVSPHDPLWWLLREQDAEVSQRDPWMLRLLDAPAAIAARGFRTVGIDVPLRITDDQLPHNGGLWNLTVRSSGEGRLVRTGTGASAQPPLVLGAGGLAALYAGTPLSTLRRAGLATDGTPESDAALDSAFAAAPYLLDGF